MILSALDYSLEKAHVIMHSTACTNIPSKSGALKKMLGFYTVVKLVPSALSTTNNLQPYLGRLQMEWSHSRARLMLEAAEAVDILSI